MANDYVDLPKCPFCARALQLDAAPIVATRFATALTNTAPLTGAPTAAPTEFTGGLDDGAASSPVAPAGNAKRYPRSGATVTEWVGQYPVLWRPSGKGWEFPRVDEVAERIDAPARLCERCVRPLPPEAGHMRIHVIGVIGTPRAGKSHFLAAALNSLASEQALQDTGVEGFRATESTQDHLNEMADTIEWDATVLGKTKVDESVVDRPLTFRARVAGTERLFLFHDIAGEQLQSKDSRDIEVAFLPEAAGIVFLVDPLGTRAVYQGLPAGHPAIATTADGGRARPPRQIGLVNAIADDLERAGRLDTMPTAFAINKCDLLFQVFGSIDPALHAGDQAFTVAGHEQREAAITQKLIPLLDDPGLVAALNRFGNPSLHLIATIGSQPSGERIDSFDPVRVVDPIAIVVRQIVRAETPRRRRFAFG